MLILVRLPELLLVGVDQWLRTRRQLRERQEAAVTAGTLDPESCDAWALGLWPAGFTADVDAALAVFERNIEQADLAGSHDVWVLIREVVLSLNAVDERWLAIETGEREQLCQYIDDALTAAGVDLSAVASRSGIDRDEITDEWREWVSTARLRSAASEHTEALRPSTTDSKALDGRCAC